MPLPWSRVWRDTTIDARWGSKWLVTTVPSAWPSSTNVASFYTPESTRREAWSCSVHTWLWNLYPWSRWLASRNLRQLVSENLFCLVVSIIVSSFFYFRLWFLCVIISLLVYLLLDSSGVLSPSLLSSSSAPSSSSSATPQSHQAVPNKKGEEVQYTTNKCPECLTQFSSKEEVAEHFQEIKPAHTTVSVVCVWDKKSKNFHLFSHDMQNELELNHFLWLPPFPSVVLQPCTECAPPMLLPNSCSAAAHQRIHQGCLPHVCPECGGTAKQPLFQTHLDKTCLHFARRIGYRCGILPHGCSVKLKHTVLFVLPIVLLSFLCFFTLLFLSLCRCSSCLVVFGGLNSVKSHIQQAHCDMFHKCPSCPMAFKSAPSIQNHITDQHPTLTDGQAMYCTLTNTHRFEAVSYMKINCSLTINWPSFYFFTGWSINVSCVTQFLPKSPCYISTLTLI